MNKATSEMSAIIKKDKIYSWLKPIVIAVIVTVFFYLISLNRYQSLQLFHYDAGYFARVIWLLSRFKPPVINHVVFGRINFLGDHFSPSLALLSPLLWIWSDIRILLLQQAAAIALSGLLLFKLAHKKLSFTLSIVVTASYLIFTGTLSPLISDWHPEPTSALLLFCIYYSLLYIKKTWLTVLLCLVFLGFKESNALTLIFFSIAVGLSHKKLRKTSIQIISFSFIWFMAAVKVIIPAIGGRYFYQPRMPSTLAQLWSSVLDNPEKGLLLKRVFLAFGFLPLLSIPWLLAILGELSMRLVPVESIFQNYSLEMHYNAHLAVFLSLGALDSLVMIKKRFGNKLINPLIIIWVAGFSLYAARRYRSPINLLVNPVFYQKLDSQRVDFDQLVSLVPNDGSLMAQNNLLLYFFRQQDQVYLLESSYELRSPKYIVLSTQKDQNINNFYGPSGLVGSDFTETIKADLGDDDCYQLKEEIGVYYLYQRRSDCT